MSGNLSACTVRNRTETLDPTFGLPCTIVEADDQLLQRSPITTQHAKRLLQAQRVEERDAQQAGQDDLEKTLHVVHASSSLRLDA
jgi:hypothetical protein